MTDLTKVRVPLTMLHDNVGPGWTTLFVREGSDDEAIIDEIVVQDVYHLRGVDLAPKGTHYTQRVGFNEIVAEYDEMPAQTVVDIGANIGVFTMTCVRMGAGRVIAVEPEPGNLEMLRHNVGQHANVVEIAACAVGAERGTRYVVGDTGTAHVSRTQMDPDTAVEQITLADLLEPLERVSVLKLDVEGSEADILLACPHELLARCDRIVGEAHGPAACPWMETPRWGEIVEHLLETHSVDIFGRPSEGGGHFYAHSYTAT